MKEIIIYTDGACSGNPGPGGWAALLRHGEHQKVVSGGERMTTNNRMELTAALEALRALKQPCKVSLHTDSAYLHNAFTQGWLDKWQRNGWKTSSKKPVENKDLWEALLNVSERHDVSWVKVKGHADDEMNNLVDEVAVAAMEEYKM
ncbi:MAG: ribonuclease HI [Rhodothermales bacterium]